MAYDVYTQGADPVTHARLAEMLTADLGESIDGDLEEVGYGDLVKLPEGEQQAILGRLFGVGVDGGGDDA